VNHSLNGARLGPSSFHPIVGRTEAVDDALCECAAGGEPSTGHRLTTTLVITEVRNARGVRTARGEAWGSSTMRNLLAQPVVGFTGNGDVRSFGLVAEGDPAGAALMQPPPVYSPRTRSPGAVGGMWGVAASSKPTQPLLRNSWSRTRQST
jgi:hypothetical protein